MRTASEKSEAVITVKHNGVLIQDHFKIDGPTGGGKKEDPGRRRPVRPALPPGARQPGCYRNVWIVEKK